MASVVLHRRTEQCWGEGKKAHMGNYNRSNSTRFTSWLNLNPNPNPNLPQNLTRNSKTNLVWHMGDPKNHIRHKNEPPKRSSATPLPPAFHVSQQKPEGPVLPKDPFHGGYVTYNLASYSNWELKELKKRLTLELQSVRGLLERIEARHVELTVGLVDTKFMPPPSIRQSHHVLETSAEKQTPKRSQQSGSSGFLSASGKIKKMVSGQKRAPPFAAGPDSKRSMVSNSETQGVKNAMMSKCKQMLMKLMKLKHAFVFNEPVDVERLKLHDYYQIIKHPMDLGTVRSKLYKKEYQSPLYFASDVRLTFENAMKYNPKGHEVHTTADSMLQKFEKLFQPEYDKFETEYRKAMTANPVKKCRLPELVAAEEENYMKMPSLPSTMSSRPDTVANMMQSAVSGNLTLPKPRPKAKNPNRRPMTFEEKQNLVNHLANILPEKMEQVVHIMRKMSPQLLLYGGDFELDIESLDTEVLWELDKFVRNHKRTCGKLKQDPLENASAKEIKNATLNEVLKDYRPSQMQEVSGQKNKKWEAGEEDIDIGEELPAEDFPPVEIEKDPTGAGDGSSSSGSSSCSGDESSSSTDSDSGSSSGRHRSNSNLKEALEFASKGF